MIRTENGSIKLTIYKNNLHIHSLCFKGAPLRSGFLRTIADHRKQYLLIRSPILIFLKPSFYNVELFIVILQSVFLDIYSGPEFHFGKLGEFPSLVTLVREDFFI